MQAPNRTRRARVAGAPAKETAPRGRPRSESCHAKILDATVEMMEEDLYDGLTIEGVAERAGVSKQTIYKWWPTKSRLAMEACLSRSQRDIVDPDTGSVEEDLRAFLTRTCLALGNGRWGFAVASVIGAAQANSEVAREFREGFIEKRRSVGARLLERGVERGEVRKNLDIPLTLDLMYGPIWYRLLLRNAPLDAAFARGIVNKLWPAIRAFDVAKRPS